LRRRGKYRQIAFRLSILFAVHGHPLPFGMGPSRNDVSTDAIIGEEKML
jgi:hypothetical protein